MSQWSEQAWNGLRSAHARRRRDNRREEQNKPKESFDSFLSRKRREVENGFLRSAVKDWT